jgi:hypothetical protein
VRIGGPYAPRVLASTLPADQQHAVLFVQDRVSGCYTSPATLNRGLAAHSPKGNRKMTTNQEMTRNATLVFLRYEDAEVSTMGILNLRTLLETDAEVKETLTAATTHWVNTTQAGRSLWNYSCADLNIGDLASSSAFQDEAFLAALRDRGVEYVDCFVGDCDDAIAYDEVLVNEEEVVEEATESPQA